MPDFEFVKAVDERLVSPSVDLWDFFNLKYIIGQGPTYVRSVSKSNDNVGNCLSNDDDLKYYVLTSKKENSEPFSTSPKPNCKDISNQPSSSKAATFNMTAEDQESSHAMNHVQVRISSFLNQDKQKFSAHSVVMCLPVDK